MDMSKLPRLSRTDTSNDTSEPSDGAPRTEHRPESGRRDEPPPSFLVEAWLSIGLGLVLLVIFPTTLKYWSSKVFHTKFTPFAHIDEAGNQTLVDYATIELDGQVVATIPYKDTPPAFQAAPGVMAEISPNFWSDFVVTAFALALIVEGIAMVLSRHAIVVLAAFGVTVAATLANLIFFARAYSHYGVLPLLSMIAVLIGGYMAFSQWRLFQWRFAPAPAAEPDYEPTAAPTPRPTADPTKALLGRVLGGEPKVRCTHYKFAHQALRQAAMENPAKCVGLLQSPVSQRFLNDLWDAVRTGCTQSADPGQPPEPGPQGLEADMTQVGPYSAVIVTLPKPQVPTEAFFVAMVLRSYIRHEDGLTVDRHPVLLYYTLEHGGVRDDGSPRTILCEWQAGTHLAYGDGPPPEASAFRDAIRAKVDLLEKKEDEAGSKTSFG